jgi:hypothetical protein
MRREPRHTNALTARPALIHCAVVLASCAAPAIDVIPTGANSYEISVPTKNMSMVTFSISQTHEMPGYAVRAPNVPAAEERAEQRAREYCAEMNKAMAVTGRGFDPGSGLTFIFSCVSSQQEPVAR